MFVKNQSVLNKPNYSSTKIDTFDKRFQNHVRLALGLLCVTQHVSSHYKGDPYYII